MKYDSKKSMVILYIISMTIAFTTQYADYEIGYGLQIIIGLLWIFLGIWKLDINGFKFRGVYKDDFPRFLKLYLLPHIVIHGYTIILMCFGIVDKKYFTTNLTVYVPTVLAIFAIYLLGINALYYTVVSLLLSWLLSVSVSLAIKGPMIIIHAIRQGLIDPFDTTGGLSMNYFELHDLVLAIGYVMVYYIFSKEKLTKKNIAIIMFVFLIMILGLKRISVIALVLVIIFNLLIKLFNNKLQNRICFILSILGVVFCYFYIYIMTDGDVFYDFIQSMGINVMGRNYYYRAIMDYAQFKPSFLGIGRNVVTQLLNTELSYLHVGGVHSDIIKMYVENGFILFGGWLAYYLVYLKNVYKKHYSKKSVILYFEIIIYMFTLYLTDNVEIYFICQILAIMIPVTYALKTKYNY